MQNKKRPVLYLNYTSYLTLGILRSQVGIPLKKLGKEGNPFILISCERLADYFKKDEINKIKKDFKQNNVDIYFLPKFLPKYLHVVPSWIRKGTFIIPFILDIIFFILFAFMIVLFKRVKIIHARSYVPAAVGVLLKKILRVKLIFDPRGIIPEELQVAKGWNSNSFKYKTWKKIEKWILKNSDLTFALSGPFREHLMNIWNKNEIPVTPCCVDTDFFIYDIKKRDHLRAEKNITDKFVILYSVGCFVPYQAMEESVQIFNQIKTHRPNAVLWICTPDDETIKNYLKEKGLFSDDIEIFSAPFSKMPEINLSADLGLLVRHKSIISKVASPVKFAEYLASGLPVAAYPEIGDTQKIIINNSLGFIIYPHDPEKTDKVIQNFFSEIKSNLHSIKENCAKTANKELSIRQITEKYKQVYLLLS